MGNGSPSCEDPQKWQEKSGGGAAYTGAVMIMGFNDGKHPISVAINYTISGP